MLRAPVYPQAEGNVPETVPRGQDLGRQLVALREIPISTHMLDYRQALRDGRFMGNVSDRSRLLDEALIDFNEFRQMAQRPWDVGTDVPSLNLARQVTRLAARVDGQLDDPSEILH